MKELKKLENWLKENNIQHELKSIFENEDQIIINIKKRKISCISHEFSYGGKLGLIELWDFKSDPKGYLTAEKAEKIINKWR